MDTQDEICRSYRMAKDRTKQIQIMAELNGVSREEIIKTLVRGGEIPSEETEQNTGSKAKTVSEAVVMPCMPRAVRDAHCGIKISEMKFEYWMITLFGTCIFNTREEAEAALHMQGDRHD